MQQITKTFQTRSNLITVLLVLGMLPMVLVRVFVLEPVVTPDSQLYMHIASNVNNFNCFSHLELSSGCTPTWGSNQPAGYPLFIALIQSFQTPGSSAQEIAHQVVFWQSVLFSIASMLALSASYRWHNNRLALSFSWLVMAFSPLALGWSHWVLTETLAATGGLLVLAAIFHALAKKCMSPVLAGLAVGFAFSFRWDQIWLLIPAFLVAVNLGGLKKGLKQMLWMGLLALLPLTAMVLRASLVGISPLPENSMESDPDLSPEVWHYYRASALKQQVTSGFFWPMWDREYEWLKDSYVPTSMIPAARNKEFLTLLEQVSLLPNGTPLPARLTASFQRMADKLNQAKFITKVVVVFQRAFFMWTDKDNIFYSGWDFSPLKPWIEPFARAYRLGLILAILLAVSFARGEKRVLAIGLFLYAFFRTLFCASFTMIEIRYLVPMFPFLELTLLSLLGFFLRSVLPRKSGVE